MSTLKTCVIAIGNSDNKLEQHEWSDFDTSIMEIIHSLSEDIHAVTYALSNSRWQNAVYLFTIRERNLNDLREILSTIALKFLQDEIAILVGDTEMVKKAASI